MHRSLLRPWLVLFLSRLGVCVALDTAAIPQTAQAQSTLVVDDDGQGTAATCDAGRSTYSSMQAAVDGTSFGAATERAVEMACPHRTWAPVRGGGLGEGSGGGGLQRRTNGMR